jgi:sodium transport system permease protein
MRNAVIVFKKEFYRVISDKRLLLMSVLFPGIMIFVMYSLMGGAISGENQDIQDHVMVIYEENMPETIKLLINPIETGNTEPTINAEFNDATELTVAERETMLEEGTMDLYVSYPADFEENLLDYENPSYVIPSIDMSYNSNEKYSNSSYWAVQSVMGFYSSIVNVEIW